ncbi:MAG: RIP metalloprotease RseP [Nitrospirota bacterium]|jgi:regulator of sigma E protease
MTLLYAVILLGILIFVHELGHFLFAKVVGVKVEKFSLGFGPKLVGMKRGETEYMISAFPLGGYVKMLGESPGEEAERPLSEEDRRRAFNHQPVWKRFLIVFSGPVFNIVFAAVVFILLFMSGVPVLKSEVGEVMEGTPAAQAGLQKGDEIVSIDGTPITEWSGMSAVIQKSPGKELALTVKRDGRTLTLTITPEKKTVKDIFGEPREVGLIGIRPSGAQYTKELSPPEAVVTGVQKTGEICVLTVVAIVKLIERVVPAKTIGGPIFIFQLAGQTAERGALDFFTFMAVISINLGIINVLPIPVLDGGHLLFLGIEAVRRKPLSEKTIALAQKVGIVVLIMIMAFALYNDILRIITGQEIP